MRRETTFSASSRSSQAGADFGGAAASISATLFPDGASAIASDAPTRPPPTMTTSHEKMGRTPFSSPTIGFRIPAAEKGCASLFFHQRFDLADLLGHAGGQDARSLVGHEHVVLDAHADAPVLRVDARGAGR